ncbi:hypothetical protein LCGC14_2792010, partial [marine sediment metagenome]
MPDNATDPARAVEMRHETIDAAGTPAGALDALAGQAQPALLESSALDPRYGRYSVLACRPREILTVRDGRVLDGAGHRLGGETVLDALRVGLNRFRSTGELPTPYGPGWIGYVGYEFGRHIERLPGRAVRDTSLPDLHLAFYDAAAVYDAIEKRWTLSWLDCPAAAEARDALHEVGGRRFLLAPECSIDPQTPEANLRAMLE